MGNTLFKQKWPLHKTNEYTRLILDATNEGIGMLNREGHILYLNKKFADRFNRSVEEMLGMNMLSLLPESQPRDLAQKRLEIVQKVFDSGQPMANEYYRDGILFYNRYYPVLKDGKVSSVALFSIDLTNRKKAEDEACRDAVLAKEAEILIQKDREYLQVIDGSTKGSWIYDFSSDTLVISNQWKERLCAQGIPCKNIGMYIDALHPDDAKEYAEAIKTVVQTKPVKYKHEYRLRTNGGGCIWVLDQGKIMYDASGFPVKIYGTSTDITDKKRVEEDLKRTIEALKQKSKLVTDFFLNLSHEFRTPISVLLLASEMLEHCLDEEKQLEREAIIRQIAIMKHNALRLNRMAGNLLDITRIDAGFMTPNWESTNIVCLLHELADGIRRFTDKSGLRLICSLASASITMVSDPHMIERIVLNLISNAIKHTRKGGLIQMRCENLDSKIIVSVKDNGQGIPQDKRGIIFDRFRQVNTSLTRSSEGCGIGLALSNELAKLLGGRIWFESSLGKGSEFFLELPTTQEQSEKQSGETNGMDLDTRIQMEFSDIYTF